MVSTKTNLNSLIADQLVSQPKTNCSSPGSRDSHSPGGDCPASPGEFRQGVHWLLDACCLIMQQTHNLPFLIFVCEEIISKKAKKKEKEEGKKCRPRYI